jgi:hypothetical protein
MLFDPDKPWYHGSPKRLTVLRAGSTVTQNRELARVFSHKPAIVVGDESDESKEHWKHTGPFKQGFLYKLAGSVVDGDIELVPNTSLSFGQEWNTRREFALVLDTVTAIDPAELLTKSELLRLVSDGFVERETADQILKNQDISD